jgi:hypothetical protein
MASLFLFKWRVVWRVVWALCNKVLSSTFLPAIAPFSGIRNSLPVSVATDHSWSRFWSMRYMVAASHSTSAGHFCVMVKITEFRPGGPVAVSVQK